MSVEYYLVCHDCKEYCWMCSGGASGPQLQVWGHKKQAGFIIDHRECRLVVVDEHEADSDFWSDCCADYTDISEK